MSTADVEWIGVSHVAAELGLTDREAWELVKRLGVDCLGPTRDCMRKARFTRADWERARDDSKRPPTPRASARAPKKAPRVAPAGPGIRLMDVVRQARKAKGA
jgi:hypothetical protein